MSDSKKNDEIKPAVQAKRVAEEYKENFGVATRRGFVRALFNYIETHSRPGPR